MSGCDPKHLDPDPFLPFRTLDKAHRHVRRMLDGFKNEGYQFEGWTFRYKIRFNKDSRLWELRVVTYGNQDSGNANPLYV